MNAPNAPWVCTAAPNDSEATDAMPGLVAEPYDKCAESAKLEQVVKANLRGLGYGE